MARRVMMDKKISTMFSQEHPAARSARKPGGERVTDHPGGDDSPVTGESGDGAEPDARYTFANERTFLAWSRTSLALVVGGLAIAQLLPPFPGIPWGRHIIGTPLILLGCAVSVISYLEWKASQRALRHGRPLPRSRLPQVLAIAITVIGLIAAALALLSAVGVP
jgi:inner membrane protein YidH